MLLVESCPSTTSRPQPFFTLDLAGNRLGYDHNSANNAKDETITYTVNARDQVMTEDSTINANDKTYAYDDNGSMTAKGSATYTWDLRGRMITATVGGSTTTIGYDSDGQRISEQTGPDPTTYYVNDKQNLTGYPQIIEERSGTTPANATLVRSYTIGLRVEGQADIANSTVTATFYIIDGHGSTRSLLDSAGHEVQRYDYRAFGEAQYFAAYDSGTQTWTAITPTGALTIHLFGGDGETDRALGLDYHDARWRDGFHFVSWDPAENNWADPQSLHKYLYCGDNPISRIDPSGRSFMGELLVTTGIRMLLTGLTFGATATIYARYGRGLPWADSLSYGWSMAWRASLTAMPYVGPVIGMYYLYQVAKAAVNGELDSTSRLELAIYLAEALVLHRVLTDVAPLPQGANSPTMTIDEINGQLGFDILQINPSGFKTNCWNCVYRFEALMKDMNLGPAGDSDTISPARFESAMNGKFQPISPLEVVRLLKSAGSGARGIVKVPGHVFEAVNIRGQVYFLDVQTGEIFDSWGSAQSVEFMPRNVPVPGIPSVSVPPPQGGNQ